MKNYIVTRNNNEGMSFSLFIMSGGRKDIVPGTAHFLEHILATGYEEDEKKIEKELKEYGISHDAYTTRDCIKIGYTYPTSISLYNEDVWKKSVDLFSLRFSRALDGSTFKKNIIDKERSIILNEEGIENNDSKIIHKVFNDISDNHENCPRIIGEAKDIKKINKKVLWDYFKKHCTQDNIFLTISLPKSLSDEKVNELVNYMLENWIDVIPEGKYTHFLEKYKKAGHNTARLRKDLPDKLVYTGVTTDSLYCILDTSNLNYIDHQLIGEVLHQWSFDKIREEKSLCYFAGCGLMGGFANHKYCLVSSADREHFNEIITTWLEKLKNNFSFTQKEKNMAINKLRGVYELDSSKNADLNFIEDVIISSDFKYLRELLRKREYDPNFSPYQDFIKELKDVPITDKAREKRNLQTFKDFGQYAAYNFTVIHKLKDDE